MSNAPALVSWIPGWWFTWFALATFGTAVLAFVTALILGRPKQVSAAPPPPPAGYGVWSPGVAVLDHTPVRALVEQPFVVWLLWLFGSWFAYMVVSVVLFVTVNVLRAIYN